MGMNLFREDQLEIARRVAKQFLPHVKEADIRIDTNDTPADMLYIGEYSLYSTNAGYLIEVFVAAPYRYNEPPDGDMVEVGVVPGFYDALAEIVSHQQKNAVHQFIMDLLCNPQD
jgi:hypothetical protein